MIGVVRGINVFLLSGKADPETDPILVIPRNVSLIFFRTRGSAQSGSLAIKSNCSLNPFLCDALVQTHKQSGIER